MLFMLFHLLGFFGAIPLLLALSLWNTQQAQIPQSYMMRDYVHPYYLMQRILNQSKERNLLLIVTLPLILTPMAIPIFPLALVWLGAFSEGASQLRERKEAGNPLITLAEKYPETFALMQRESPHIISNLDDWFAKQIPHSASQFKGDYCQSDTTLWESQIYKIRDETKHYLLRIWDIHHQEKANIGDLAKQLQIFNEESRSLLHSFENQYTCRNLLS